MPALPFSSLTPQQQAQAATIFRDNVFGTDPAAYAYELEAATGHLSGQRSQVGPLGRKVQHGKRSPLYVSTSGQLVLSNQSAQVFASLILLDLLKSQEQTMGPDTDDLLVVAAPSLRLSGWETAGQEFYE
jgi:hypothetical protein